MRRKTWLLLAGLALLAILAVLLGSSRDGSRSKPAAYSVRGHVQPGWHGRPEPPMRSAEELWSGTVSLKLNTFYGLAEQPGASLQQCGGCVNLEEPSRGEVALHAVNGIFRWPREHAPSYRECVRMREGGSEDAVVLATPGHPAGLAPGAWMCATVHNDAISRLRYEGPDGAGYRFEVMTWKRPFME